MPPPRPPRLLGRDPDSEIEGINLHAKCARELADQQAASTFEAFYLPYKDTALFGVKVNVPDVKVDDVMWYTCNNLVRLCFEVTEVELVRAKLAYKNKLVADCASPDKAVAIIASTLSVGPFSPAEMAAAVDAVTLADVKAACYKYIHDNDHALAACGPLHELPDYNWVRSASYNYHY